MSARIHNIVFAFPAPTFDDYKRNGRAYASFYAELLGMRIIREDWFKIAKDESRSPQLAFGDGPGEYRAPQWPDPDHPQQLHLDIFTSDLDAADELALRLGATRLQDKGGYRSYADPVGHPFCLYRDARLDEAAEPTSGRIGRVVFDCFSPRALAAFYEGLMGMRTRIEDTPDRVVITRDDGSLPMLAFQHAPHHTAPRWPDPVYPQQVHLDLHADDGDAGQEMALRLGAIRLSEMGGSCPVFADPAGHPFCLCTPGQ